MNIDSLSGTYRTSQPCLLHREPAGYRSLSEVLNTILAAQRTKRFLPSIILVRPIMRYSIVVTIILVAASILGFLAGGYLERATTLYLVTYVGSLILALWFGVKLPPRDLVVLGVSSVTVAVLVEPIMTSAGLWTYTSTQGEPLLYPFFSFSILFLLMLLLAKVVDRAFKRFRESVIPKIVALPATVVAVGLLAWVEGYAALFNWYAVFVYAVLSLLSLYYIVRSDSSWVISTLICGVVVAAAMEAAGSLSGLWSYPYSPIVPLFLPVAWILNAWAILGLSLIMGTNLASTTRRIGLPLIPPEPPAPTE